jgi:endonuclease/exonuclease/phosphatase (EEP) superfamily protein YafD
MLATLIGSLVVLTTALPFLPFKAWWIRIWDFPRLQLAILGLLAIAIMLIQGRPRDAWDVVFGLLVLAAVLQQASLVWRYTRLAPREVQVARRSDPSRQISLVISNVLQDNRDAERMLAETRAADPDVAFFVETDEWWRERLQVMLSTHPHAVEHPLDNTYGMLLYSRLPIEQSSVNFLVQEDVPSIQAMVTLRCGVSVWLNCVHPRPPVPGESDESLPRDAELLLVGKRVCDADVPVIVCGDLNDVAWSHTTRLFQRLSGLLDPRKGRGLYSTFHARYPGLRFPLDHVFHSADFRLVRLLKLGYVGSDHFPVHIVLSHEPEAEPGQQVPDADERDEREAVETVAEGVVREDD